MKIVDFGSDDAPLVRLSSPERRLIWLALVRLARTLDDKDKKRDQALRLSQQIDGMKGGRK